MIKTISIVKLTGFNNYAILSPGRIVFGLDATARELNNLIVEEELKIRENPDFKENNSQNIKSGDTIGLIPTFDCNLSCNYCYSRGGETKEIIPFEIAQTAILSVRDNGSSDSLDIYLVGGGEPLLYPNLAKRIVKFAQSLYKTIRVHIVTNGLFDQDTLGWIKSINSTIRVSYDGVMQDSQRLLVDGKSSREFVRRNIINLVEAKIPITVQCIITKDGVGSILDTIDDVIGLGVSVIKLEPVLATLVSRANESMEPNPIEYARALLGAITHIAKRGYNLKIDTGYLSEPSNKYYCGMQKNNIIVTPAGLITTCVEVTRCTDPFSDLVIIGKIENGRIIINEDKRSRLSLFNIDNQGDDCRNCNMRLICHGGCPMSNLWKSGLPYGKSKFTCMVERELLPKLLLLMAENESVTKIVLDNAEMQIC